MGHIETPKSAVNIDPFTQFRAVEALEVYKGLDTPSEYYNSCGAVLIWMRRFGRE